MTEREVVGVAMAMAVAAIVAVSVPLWILAVVSIGAVALRHPVAVGAAAMLVTSTLAARAESGLVDGPEGRVQGWATLVSDPIPSVGGARAEVSIDGRRYAASFPADRRDVADALAGEAFRLRGVVTRHGGPHGYRASRHLSGRMSVLSLSGRRPATGARGLANDLRRLMESGLGSFDDDQAALFTGIVYGDDRAQDDVTVYRFRRSGLAHLMAVSGQNVAFVLLVAAPLLLRVDLRYRLLLTAVLVGLFVAVTRAEPSVLRASTMVMVVAYVAWRGRYATALRVLALAVSILLLVDPLMVWSVGFQLSVGASAALVSMVSPLTASRERPKWWHLAFAASVAAQAGTAPVLAGVAGSVPLIGPMVNLVAVPLAGAVMAYGVCAAPIAGLLGDPFATWVGWPSRILVSSLDHLATWGSVAWLPSVGLLGALALSAATVAVAFGPGSMRRVAVIAAAAIVTFDVIAGAPAGRIESSHAARMWVGDGHAVVVLDGSSRDDAVLSALTRGRVRTVGHVIVTGGGSRAAGVAVALREVMPVGVVWAVDPDTVRDSVQLTSMVLPIGGVCLRVDVSVDGVEVGESSSNGRRCSGDGPAVATDDGGR